MLIFKKERKMDKMNVLNFALVFALIFYNNETFPSIYFKGSIETIILLFIIITSIFLYTITFRKVKVDMQATLLVLFLICTVLTTMLLNSDTTGGYIKILLCLLIGYMVLHLISFQDFIKSYISIILILSLYSLLTIYIIRPITFSMPAMVFPRFYNIAGVPIINARFSFIVNSMSYYRNFGIFREPGVYQIFLNFALMFELFFKRIKPSLVKVTIFYITIISTFSTPGYLAGSILILTYTFLGGSKIVHGHTQKNKKKFLIFITVILVMTAILYINNDIFNTMFLETFRKLGSEQTSYQGRIYAILANLSTWSERPIFGSGISMGLGSNIKKSMQSNFYFPTAHNTTTIGALLSTFGLLFTLIYVFLIYKLTSKCYQPKLIKLLIWSAIMIVINTQLLIYNELLYTIVFYGICKIRDKKKTCHANSGNLNDNYNL